MTHVVNLLPWRDLRRRQRLRYVLLLTIGIVLLGGMGLLVSRTARLQRDFLATLHTTADAQLLALVWNNLLSNAVKFTEPHGKISLSLRTQREFAVIQVSDTGCGIPPIAAWQPRLQALAADLPAQAWLTRLEYQGVLLTLDGLALNLQALTSVEAALTRVAGFAPAKAGGTQRDAEGRWQFSFTLTGARADAD